MKEKDETYSYYNQCCSNSDWEGCINREKIRFLREEKNLNRKAFAQLCGITNTVMWKIEVLPRYRVQMCEMYKIASAFGLLVDDLLIKA